MAVSEIREEPEKLRDFRLNPSYERRVVAFYDILGWRTEIEQAGRDPEKIGNLRRLILQHSRLLRLPVQTRVNVSTFSDNIVISSEVNKDTTPYFLRELAVLQVMTLSIGFLLRGAVTVGDIIHDEEVVFGPALNRAYELESKVAIFPRMVIDEPVLEIGKIEGFHVKEDGITFLDPFTTGFIKHWIDRAATGKRHQEFMDAGLPSTGRSLKDVPGDIALRALLNHLKPRIRAPLRERERSKVAWLYDRIAARLGDPPANSYPRIRIPDEQA